jgi:UDP-MurNAc hydroxylase
VVLDGGSCLVNQNDCRTHDPAALAAHGKVDQHWLQFSGAIWYPMVYDEPSDVLQGVARAKVESQFARADQYVDAVGATVVVPSAGPPCFLDEELFSFNMIRGDELSIFPDQSVFIDRLSQRGVRAALNVPGSTITVENDEVVVEHPDLDVNEPFTNKLQYLRRYQSDWQAWLAKERAQWPQKTGLFQPRLAALWEPLLVRSPALRSGIGGRCLIHSGDETILIDFPAGTIRPHHGEDVEFRFEIPPELLEKVIAERAVDWSNSLFLSCRFRAWRKGAFNEYLYNFLKSLSLERIERAEIEARRRLGGTDAPSEEIQIGDYTIERYCPHRRADLSIFGVLEGDEIICTLHGWRFSTSDGTCRTTDDCRLQIRRTR